MADLVCGVGGSGARVVLYEGVGVVLVRREVSFFYFSSFLYLGFEGGFGWI